MAEEKQTVSGEVGKINLWKKGNGYFLMLMGVEQEFYAFGKPKVKVGGQVTFEVSPGTGNFEDKVQLDKLVKGAAEKAKPTEKVPAKKTEMKQLMEKGDEIYFSRQNLIVRQTCIKAAAEVIGHVAPKGALNTQSGLANAVIEMADELYGWVTMRDEELPEPPEEP